jgi:hypothetical protein
MFTTALDHVIQGKNFVPEYKQNAVSKVKSFFGFVPRSKTVVNVLDVKNDGQAVVSISSAPGYSMIVKNPKNQVIFNDISGPVSSHIHRGIVGKYTVEMEKIS